LSVTVITFVFPFGGVVLTLQNLGRLALVERSDVRRLSALLVVVFALGLTALLCIAGVSPTGSPKVDTDTWTILSVGFALVAYVVQRSPFRAWLAADPRGTSTWLSGILTAVLYQLLPVLLAIPLYIAADALGYSSSGVLGL
jgi:hypothetical protein